MPIFDLPDEVLVRCFKEEDLTAIRLTCKQFSFLSAGLLFSRLRLTPSAKNAMNVRSIQKDKGLSALVTELSIEPYMWGTNPLGRDRVSFPNPCWELDMLNIDQSEPSLGDVDPELPYGFEFYPGYRSDKVDPTAVVRHKPYQSIPESYGVSHKHEISEILKQAISMIGLFVNLRRVALIHDRCILSPSQSVSESRVSQTLEFREKLFREVLKALNHPIRPVRNLRSLRIFNLQDVFDKSLLSATDFEAVMSRVVDLQLSVAMPGELSQSHREILIPEQHDFFEEDLPLYWLQPVQTHLVRLDLSRNGLWGYCPKAELRGLHFPSLKSLTLREMTFSHDWQLQWILSHGESLMSLNLYGCVIVYSIWLADDQDAEGYPRLTYDYRTWDSRDRNDVTHWAYEGRWYIFFRKMIEGLPCLCDMQYNTEWSHDSHAEMERDDYRVFYSAGFQGSNERYLCPPEEWFIPGKRHWSGINARWPLRDQFKFRSELWYPDCLEEDQKALDELLEVVKCRRNVRSNQ